MTSNATLTPEEADEVTVENLRRSLENLQDGEVPAEEAFLIKCLTAVIEYYAVQE